MPGPLSYEPSLRSVVTDVLPLDTRLLTGSAGLRRRVSWPVLARATGIGEVEGGEIVLVPTGRARDVLARLTELNAAGVAGIILVGNDTSLAVSGAALPVVLVPPRTDLRRLQGDIERYVARRRRELFAFDQELHHILIDNALSGADLSTLLASAAAKASRLMAVDRDGDLLVAGAAGDEEPSPDFLFTARMACRDPQVGCVEFEGPPPALAVAITAGKTRRGIAVLVGPGGGITDEDEACVTALASACAIRLARDPESPVPTLEEALIVIESSEAAPAPWTAFALADRAETASALGRALAAELAARNIAGSRPALAGHAAIALLPVTTMPAWEVLRRAVGMRLGSSAVRAAVGRAHDGRQGARRSAEEALETLERAPPAEVTSFESVELVTLLSATPRWQEFARRRLAPLLGGAADQRDLLLTLRVYLAAGHNAKAAARLLQVHRNTLLYRLRRIEHRLGVRLDDPETLFTLDLATRVVALKEPNLDARDDTG